MNRTVCIREYQPKDTQKLADIIRRTWNYDSLASAKTAKRLGKVYLYSCLINQTSAKVAVMDGEPVGIIMGKNNRNYRRSFRYSFKQALAIISLYSCREGRQVSRIFQRVNGIDQKLLQMCEKTYAGEIAFFAVDPNQRGQGIGKQMFRSMTEQLRNEGVDEIYLFTDTTCNYGFYEHQGMKRRQEMTEWFSLGGQKVKMTFFLYDLSLRGNSGSKENRI